MLPQWIIEKKRDGQLLTDDEIRSFVQGFTSGDIPDYQMAAFAMAVYFRGMQDAELTALTEAMMNSGEVLDLSCLDKPTVDKHSTGGIGDKVSLPLTPLVACCGAAVPMLSGRGLGITGGTLDKLEAIPGFRTDLSVPELIQTLKQCGCVITGQTARLAPADKKLYALRDVTGTVPSIPLIAASIMSKKLAENTRGLVLDVKVGSGAFMKKIEDARKLAQAMLTIGCRCQKQMAALITDMDQPLGHNAGNALEIAETVDILTTGKPDDVTHLTLELGCRMLTVAGLTDSAAGAKPLLEKALYSGRAFERFKEMIELQGGNPRVIDKPALLPQAAIRKEIRSPFAGWIKSMNAEIIGRACLLAGAGRRKTTDSIDPAAGVSGIRKTGEHVSAGEPVIILHANNHRLADECCRILQDAFTISDTVVKKNALIKEIILP